MDIPVFTVDERDPVRVTFDALSPGILATPEDVPEPISLDQAKAHLRVVIADEDGYISALIVAARQMAEALLNRSLVRKQLQMTFNSTDRIYQLLKPPFIQLLSVGAIDVDGAAIDVDSGSYRVAGIGDSVALVAVRGATWPNGIAQGDTLSVMYEAGYLPGKVPQPIVQWMLLCIGTMYDHRETMAAGVQIYAMPENFQRWLLQPYMVYE